MEEAVGAFIIGFIMFNIIGWAVGIALVRWVFKINKITEILQEISEKMNLLQKHIEPEKPVTKSKPEETDQAYWPKNY